MPTSAPLLVMRDIEKRFQGVHALAKASLEVQPAEIMALVGQNGAGKSTLIKVLTGAYSRDAGSIDFAGRPIAFASPQEAQRGGISTIYQEINLVPFRSVTENIFLGREHRRFGLLDWGRMNAEAVELLRRFDVAIDVRRPLMDYSTAIQQMVAIARAVSFKAQLVIMDEPTSSLDEREVAVLFDVMRRLQVRGRRRDLHHPPPRRALPGLRPGDGDARRAHGRDAPDGRGRQASSHRRHAGARRRDGPRPRDRLFRRGGTRGRRGPVGRGACGSGGACATPGSRSGRVRSSDWRACWDPGRTETARAIFGADPPDAGSIRLMGKAITPREPADAIAMGVGYCSEDRKADGIVPDMSVRENLTLAILPRLVAMGVIDEGRQRQIVERFMKRLAIKASGPEQKIRELSGGNQQKVLLARWLCADPKLLILDEPTRGIDVGAKAEIQSLIRELADQGLGVLMISSELEEIVEGADRVFVLSDGRTVADLPHAQASAHGDHGRHGARGPGRDRGDRRMADAPIPARARRAAPDVLAFLRRYAALTALIVLLVFNFAVTPHFASFQTLNVNLTQVATIVIVSVGMTLVIATGGIDLSVGSLMAIAGALAPLIFLSPFGVAHPVLGRHRSPSSCPSRSRACSAGSTAGSSPAFRCSRSSARW